MSGQLVEQWPLKVLGEICYFENGDRGKNYPSRSTYTSSGVPIINAGHLGESGVDLDNMNYIPRERFDLLRAGRILKGDILYCLRGSLGKCAIVEGIDEGVIASSLVIIRTGPLIDNRYLLAFLKSQQGIALIQQYSNGMAQPNLSAKNLQKFTIPLPPLEEQQRTVRVIDEVFANISETVKQTQDCLFQNNELYEQMLNQIFENSNGEWIEKTLDNICTVKRGSSPRPIKSYFSEDPNGVSWIKIGDTKGVDKYITKTKQKITKEGAERSRLVNKGDLILSNSMSYGKPFIMGISGYIHDGWFVLYVNKEVDSEFLFYALSSKLVQSQFSNLAAGSVVKNISGDLVKKAVIPIPPLSEQKQIVEDIKSMTPSIKSLTYISNTKLKSLDELKQSILQEAFNGTL